MTTASFELAHSIRARTRELVALTEKARAVQDTNEVLYNALCRSCCVLLASHLEGFLRELTKSIVIDLNDNLNGFSQMPVAMQRTFCLKIAKFDGVPTVEIDARVGQLMTFFAKNSVNIDFSAFAYKESQNKNPSTSFIDSSLSKIGVGGALNAIALPSLLAVFTNDDRVTYRLNRKLLTLVSHMHGYPFRPLPDAYRPKKAREVKGKGKDEQSLWHAFVEDLMARRHQVAHGEILSNDTSWEDLKQDTDKLRVLMYSLSFAVSTFLGEVSA
jgi:hypothetical protein